MKDKDVPVGWPWNGSGKLPSELAQSQLAILGARRLRELIRKARPSPTTARVLSATRTSRASCTCLTTSWTCFWWSTFTLLRRLRWHISVFLFEHFTRPVIRLVKHKEFKYVCAYCGRKTRQPPLNGLDKLYCSDIRCIEKMLDDEARDHNA